MADKAQVEQTELSSQVSVDAVPDSPLLYRRQGHGVSEDVTLQMVELRIEEETSPPKPHKDDRNQSQHYESSLDECLSREEITESPPLSEKVFQDGVLLFHEDDELAARRFQSRVNSIRLTTGRFINIILFNETISFSVPFFKALDDVIDRTTYTFIFVTKSFTEEQLWTLVKDSCLMKTLYDPRKSWSVVPVWTEKPFGTTKVPFGLNSITGLPYYRDDQYFDQRVRHLFENDQSRVVRSVVKGNDPCPKCQTKEESNDENGEKVPRSGDRQQYRASNDDAGDNMRDEEDFENIETKIVIQDQMFVFLTQAIGDNWQLLGLSLGLTHIDIEHIETNRNTVQMRIYDMLVQWKAISEIQDKLITLEDLIQTIREIPAVSVDWKKIRNIAIRFNETSAS